MSLSSQVLLPDIAFLEVASPLNRYGAGGAVTSLLWSETNQLHFRPLQSAMVTSFSWPPHLTRRAQPE
jgi:hypothetical protein